MIPRRQFLHLGAGAVAVPVLPRMAWAQSYPTRPVQIIVGYPPGIAPDIIARLMGPWLSERLGQQFVIENRPGAGSNIATELVVRAPPDGYVFLLVTTGSAISATLYPNLNFNLTRDIAPVASIGSIIFVMVVNPSFPAKTVGEFIAYAKSNPGKINMASTGAGTAAHLYGELFKTMAGINMVHVPYRGSGGYLPDLLSGQAQIVVFTGISSSIEYIKAGKLRALAVTTATRSATLPDVPTVGEFVPGYEATGWFGVGAPKNTPIEIVDRLNVEINAGIADPNMKTRLDGLGVTPTPMASTEFGKFIADEAEKWANVIKFANIKPE